MSLFSFPLNEPLPSAENEEGDIIRNTRSSGRKSANPIVRLPLKEQRLKFLSSLERVNGRTWHLAIEAFVDIDAPRYIDEDLNRRLYPHLLPPPTNTVCFKPAKAIRLMEVEVQRENFTVLLIQEGDRLELLLQYRDLPELEDLQLRIKIYPRYDLDPEETYYRLPSDLSQLVGGLRFLCRPRVAMAAIEKYVRRKKLETRKGYLLLDDRLRFILGRNFVRRYEMYQVLLKCLEKCNVLQDYVSLEVTYVDSRHSRCGCSARGGKTVMMDARGLVLPGGWQPRWGMTRNPRGQMKRVRSESLGRSEGDDDEDREEAEEEAVASLLRRSCKLVRSRSCANIVL